MWIENGLESGNTISCSVQSRGQIERVHKGPTPIINNHIQYVDPFNLCNKNYPHPRK